MKPGDHITVKQFLTETKATSWHECHWSLAGTKEQAAAWFNAKGITGTIYQVPFGFWMVQE